MLRPLTLQTIPLDILELIVHHVSSRESFGPPRSLLNLASTCRVLYQSLALKHNTSVYGDFFRLTFDMAAPIRRFASESLSAHDSFQSSHPSSSEPPLPSTTSRIGSAGLAHELRARFAALHYMRAVVRTENVFSFTQNATLLHLWTIYFMCIESDARNAKYLFRYGKMRTYARMCMDQYLFQSLDSTALMPETIDRALMMWICWFSTSWEALSNEDLHYENKMIQFLRPINYANFNYNAYFAPWMLYDLPTNTSPETDGYSSITSNRYEADIDPRDRSVLITLYGAPLRITPPLLIHAGLAMYFARFEKRSLFESLGLRDGAYAASTAGSGSARSGPELDFEAQNAGYNFRLPTLRDSTRYDVDFYRLCACLNPRLSFGISRELLRGSFSGDWEGRFAFTDFDSFRDMLDGDDDAIHSSTIAQQPQVWSIKEHHYPPSRASTTNPSSRPLSRRGSFSGISPRKVNWSRKDIAPLHPLDRPVEVGPSLNGNLPQDISLEEQFHTESNHASRRSSLYLSHQAPGQDESASPIHTHASPTVGAGPSSPPKYPSNTLLATYTSATTGLPAQSTYSTYVPPSSSSDPTSSSAYDIDHPNHPYSSRYPSSSRRPHFTSSGSGPVPTTNAARHHLLLPAQLAMQMRDDPSVQISGYADPYGFSSPFSSQPNSHPSSSSTSLDVVMGEPGTTSGSGGGGRGSLGASGGGDGLEDIILTGKGHSAWGQFLLKGRVRLWDGMANIVKSYDGNDGRGTWLYRGYILDGGIWVGRWRDTMTQEDTNGYEGVFAMTKRSASEL